MEKSERKQIDKLVKVKYIFSKGRGFLDDYGPCTMGIAVSLLQDSVEMLLRLIAEKNHVSISKTELFHSIIDKINTKINTDGIKYKTSLNDLNSSRNNFKHSGNEPVKNDVVNFYRDMEAFFVYACSNFLNIDFSNISLVDLIGHQRTINWLKNAEDLLKNEKYVDSVGASACAFAVFRKYMCGDDFLRRDVNYPKLNVDKAVNEYFNNIEKQLNDQTDKMEMIVNGVSLPDYRKFMAMTPYISFYNSGQIHQHKMKMRVIPQREEAQFCIRFVLESALVMKEKNDYPIRGGPLMGNQNVKVTRDCSLRIFPGEDQEILLNIKKNDDFVFESLTKRSSRGYVHVFYQGDNAYLPETAVEIISP